MKIRKIIYLVIVTLLLNNIIYSQTSNSDLELMAIRQDMVKPSMTTNYEFFLADFKNYLESKNFKNFEYYTHFQDDYTFRHISPISDLNLLKTSTLSELAKQFNDPEFDLIIDEMNATLISTSNLIVKYLPELSYLPDNSTTWNATSSYREWSYYYLKPGTEAAVEKILASWRDLYKSKDVKMGFRVFTNFVGGDGPLIILTTWANDPMDYQTTLEETLKLLGTDGAGLMEAMLKNVNKTKTIEGWYLPQYSYDFSN